MTLLSAVAGGKGPIPALPSPRSLSSASEISSPSRVSQPLLGQTCSTPGSLTRSRINSGSSKSTVISAPSHALHPENSAQSISKYRYPDNTPLSTILQTLQNYNAGVPSPNMALDPSLTSQLGSPAPLLSQLQDALSSAMKTQHGISSGDPVTGAQCSLQPGRVFGKLKCPLGSLSSISSVKSIPFTGDDKLLYMYCSNNCSFQFHAACWKVGHAFCE